MRQLEVSSKRKRKITDPNRKLLQTVTTTTKTLIKLNHNSHRQIGIENERERVWVDYIVQCIIAIEMLGWN